jgi:LmbE family N-acetylglucosaminyl deacetylase
MNVVFVFAHQDDEIAFASRIRMNVGRGDRVTCVCLTDGASAVPASRRDEESNRVLATLGVPPLLVDRERIADGFLPEQMDRALAFLERAAIDAEEIVTLAWEGGHQDHDAAHLIAAVFARSRGIRCLEMPLYNGEGSPGKFFRVMHPVGDGWNARRLSVRERIGDVLLTRFYPSQRKTWLGLAPLMLLGHPRELSRVADLRRAAGPPHRGTLLYERRFRYRYARFAEEAARFLRHRADRD